MHKRTWPQPISQIVMRERKSQGEAKKIAATRGIAAIQTKPKLISPERPGLRVRRGRRWWRSAAPGSNRRQLRLSRSGQRRDSFRSSRQGPSSTRHSGSIRSALADGRQCVLELLVIHAALAVGRVDLVTRPDEQADQDDQERQKLEKFSWDVDSKSSDIIVFQEKVGLLGSGNRLLGRFTGGWAL